MKSSFVAAIIGLIVGLAIGYFARPQVETATITDIDTVWREKPIPTEVTRTEFRTLRLPVMLFAPPDTVKITNVVVDSVDVEVAIERREYSDSTYRARVSGPAIGGFHPTLDWIETYSRTIKTTTQQKPHKWGVGVQVGYGASKDGLSPYVGVGIQYHIFTF